MAKKIHMINSKADNSAIGVEHLIMLSNKSTLLLGGKSRLKVLLSFFNTIYIKGLLFALDKKSKILQILIKIGSYSFVFRTTKALI